MTRIHWVTRGTGTPKDRDEVNRRDGWECDGWLGVGKSDVYYYESIKWELQRRLTYEYRCDERLKTKTEESTHLTDTIVVYYESRKWEVKIRLMNDTGFFFVVYFWNLLLNREIVWMLFIMNQENES